MPCNCENMLCDHGEGPCKREAGKARILYIGHVCEACARMYPKEYHAKYDSEVSHGKQ